MHIMIDHCHEQALREDRARIIHLLCEGSSIRAACRLTGASKKAVSRLMVDAGQAAAWYQDRVFVNLTCKRIQVDEIWAFVYAKQKNVPMAKAAPANAGDVWTWTAIDADTKLIPSWFVGGRDSDAGMTFMDDLASRLANRVQLTSDGHRAYLDAVDGAFGTDIDYAMLVKLYGENPEAEKRYSPAVCIGAHKTVIEGRPDPKYVGARVICGTFKFERADAHSPIYPAHECLFKEGRKPRAFRRAVCDVLQFVFASIRPCGQRLQWPLALRGGFGKCRISLMYLKRGKLAVSCNSMNTINLMENDDG